MAAYGMDAPAMQPGRHGSGIHTKLRSASAPAAARIAHNRFPEAQNFPASAILGAVIQAVVFDLDGVLIDSERLWDQARREVTAQHGGRWRPDATAAMQGMSSTEWSRYLRDSLGVQLSPERISDLVVANLLGQYERGLPLLPGAIEAVQRVGRRWPLGLASSANRPVIDQVLALAGLKDAFAATVSSEEVPRGKPAPDVYLEAARRLGQPPQACAAIEDSANGIRSALAATMHVIAIPNREYPPPAPVLAAAEAVAPSLSDLTADLLERLGLGRSPPTTVYL
jgi:HAD superfamily hydrolase (TIGR01509 family)